MRPRPTRRAAPRCSTTSSTRCRRTSGTTMCSRAMRRRSTTRWSRTACFPALNSTWCGSTPSSATRRATTTPLIASLEIPQPFTLQILHFYGEAGTLATNTAPILGAMVDKFKELSPNTLVVAEGDTWIPGPWLVAGADPSLSAVPGIGSTALARPDVAILNALGVNVSALGNHESRPGLAGRVGRDRCLGRLAGRPVPLHHRQPRLQRRQRAEAARRCVDRRQTWPIFSPARRPRRSRARSRPMRWSPSTARR